VSDPIGPGADRSRGPVFELPDPAADPVLVVDDDEMVLRSLKQSLTRAGYDTRCFNSPVEALAAIRERPPRVLVTDHDMPGMTGLELAAQALEIHPEMKVLLVTGAGDEETARNALRLGVLDYLTKPFELGDLHRAVQKALAEYASDEYAIEMDRWLRDEVHRQTGLVQEVTLGTIEALLAALEARSPYFRGHSQSVAVSAAGIARELDLAPDDVKAVRTAGLLHDVGMIAVPDAVVNKPGDLDREEYALIRQHCRKGVDILTPMSHLGSSITYVLEHHERIDGSGYPDGKRGDGISLGGQIVGLAETWTALTEKRAYRDGMSLSEAMATLSGAVGSWFSRELVEAVRASEM
jgi:putative nucleotidyltransferase with HDIG domain